MIAMWPYCVAFALLLTREPFRDPKYDENSTYEVVTLATEIRRNALKTTTSVSLLDLSDKEANS